MNNILNSIEPKEKKIILVSIVIIVVCFIATLITRNLTTVKRNPQAVAGVLVGSYYENEIYTNFKNPKENVEKFKKSGITFSLYEVMKVYSDQGKNILLDFECDYKHANVKIFPKSPYEKKDYEYKVEMKCKK
ncbi:MAG: hypothetical protein RR500_03545 [Bacilli bacterium]